MFRKFLLILCLLAFATTSCKKSQDEAVKLQAAQDEAVKLQAAQDEAVKGPAAQDEAVKGPAAQGEDAKDQAAQDEAKQGDAKALLGQACLRDADCGHNGFCDSALGYQCSTRCTQNADCETFNASGDGYEYYCRGDGRCSPNVFETVWEIPEDRLRLVLPVVNKENCELEVNWGDNEKFEKVACERLEHDYAKAGEYNVKLRGRNFEWAIKPDSKEEKAVNAKNCGMTPEPNFEDSVPGLRFRTDCLKAIRAFGRVLSMGDN